jgi:hypothetical protein
MGFIGHSFLQLCTNQGFLGENKVKRQKRRASKNKKIIKFTKNGVLLG